MPVPIAYKKPFGEQAMKRIHKLIENAGDEKTSSKVTDDTSEDERSDVPMEDEDSLAGECEDEEEIYDEYLWEVLCMKCLKYNWSIYECMHKHLTLYYELEKDDPYQEIMEDVQKEEEEGSCFIDALNSAIKKHQDLIEQAVEEYRDGGPHWKNEPPNMWRYLAIPAKYRCDWYTATECKCDNNSCSLLKRFCALALTLHAMEIDDLIQNIIEAVDERDNDITRDVALDMELKVREESILLKFKRAKEKLDGMGQDEINMREMLERKFEK